MKKSQAVELARLIEEQLSAQKYLVVREYSGITRNKVLWEIVSRPLLKQSAKDWRDFEKNSQKKNKRKKVFIIPCPKGMFGQC
jgi:hypothetical protein